MDGGKQEEEQRENVRPAQRSQKSLAPHSTASTAWRPPTVDYTRNSSGARLTTKCLTYIDSARVRGSFTGWIRRLLYGPGIVRPRPAKTGGSRAQLPQPTARHLVAEHRSAYLPI